MLIERKFRDTSRSNPYFSKRRFRQIACVIETLKSIKKLLTIKTCLVFMNAFALSDLCKPAKFWSGMKTNITKILENNRAVLLRNAVIEKLDFSLAYTLLGLIVN